MSIMIKTRLADGIYKSSGGGETRTHYEYANGPRNLLKAIAQYDEHLGDMRRSYGNVGCGISWIEIDDMRMEDLRDVLRHDADGMSWYDRATAYRKSQSPTDKARDVLANIYAYSVDANRRTDHE